MAKKVTGTLENKPERVIMLCAGPSGAGKSFFVANLREALIFDTDLGGGLEYADARIKRNNSERFQVGSYLDVLDILAKRRGQLDKFTTIAIDHLTTLQQEAVQRYNPAFAENTFGREYDRANKEWRKIRELVRWGDFNLVCTAHQKSLYQNKEVIGITTDASKNIEADFSVVVYLQKGGYPAIAKVQKWRRDPEDVRGEVPPTFSFTMEEFARIHGVDFGGRRQEIPMATPEQVKRIEALLAVVKLPEEDLVQKWMAKAKAETLADFSQEAMAKCIAYLEGLMPKVEPKGDDPF